MPDIERQTAAVIASGDPEAAALRRYMDALEAGDDGAADHWLAILDEIQQQRVDASAEPE